MKRAVSWLIVAGALWSAPAFAQGDPAAAEALFRQGREAADAGDHATACARFEESNRLDPAIGTVFNIADCKEKLGLIATAWTLFQEVAQKVPSNDDRHRIAKERADTLEPRLPKLTVVARGTLPEGAKLKRDGVVLGSASLGLAIPVDPGGHTVTVTAPKREPKEFEIELAEKEAKTLEVSAGPVQSDTQGEGESQGGGGTGDVTADSGSGNGLAFTMLGVGGVGVAVGLITGFMTLGKKSEADDNCDNKRCTQKGIDAVDSGKTLGTISVVGFAVGLVGLGLGTYLVLDSDDEGQARTTLHPVAAPGTGYVSLRHSF